MIIQTKAIKASSGAGKTASHIFAGDKNEKIERLEGGDFQMKDAMTQAENNNLKYGFHHFKISPREDITREQLNETINKLSQEYKFNRDDVTLVEHTKNRADKTASNKHYHLIVPHYQSDRRKALDTKNSYARNEKIARICEIEFGHELTQGQHNSAVFRQLMDEGKTAEAERVKPLIDRDRTHQAHTVNQQRTAERKGIDLPAEKQAIKAIWKASDGMKAFQAGLSEGGYTLKAGDKENTYIIEKNGVLVGAGNRLTGTKKEDFAQQYRSMQNDTATAETAVKLPERGIEQDSGISKPSETRSDEHRPDNRIANPGTSGTKPTGTDIGRTESDIGTERQNPRDANGLNENVRKNIRVIKINTSLKNNSLFNDASLFMSEQQRKRYEQKKQLEEMIKMIGEMLDRLFGHSGNYRQKIIEKHNIKLINDEIEQRKQIIRNRPIVRKTADIRADYISERMKKHNIAKKKLSEFTSKIERLENKKYGFFKYFKKEYKDDLKKLHEMKNHKNTLAENVRKTSHDISRARENVFGKERAQSYAEDERKKDIQKLNQYDKTNQTEQKKAEIVILEAMKQSPPKEPQTPEKIKEKMKEVVQSQENKTAGQATLERQKDQAEEEERRRQAGPKM